MVPIKRDRSHQSDRILIPLVGFVSSAICSPHLDSLPREIILTRLIPGFASWRDMSNRHASLTCS